MPQLTPQESINLIDKWVSGEISDKDFFQRIPSKLELGENYLQSQQGWSRFFQRSAKRTIGIPKGIAEAAQGGFGVERLVDLWNQHGQHAPAVWAYEIGRGSTLGVAELAWELMLGHGDIGDAVEVAASIAPFGRVANTARAAKYVNTIRNADPTARAKIFAEGYQKTIQEVARRRSAGDTTPVQFQRYRVKDLELTQQEFEYLKSVGAIDRALNYGETAAEVAEILFNPEELVDTVAFSGIMRGINRIMQQDPSQFQDQVGVPPDTSQGPVPVEDTPPVQNFPTLPPGVLGIDPTVQPRQQPVAALPGTTTQPGQTVVTPPPATTAFPGQEPPPVGGVTPTPATQAVISPPTPQQQPVGALPPAATPLPEHAGSTELENARARAETEHQALIDATIERIVGQVSPQRQQAIGVAPGQTPTPDQQALALAGIDPQLATGVAPQQQPVGAIPEHTSITTPPPGQDIESLRRQLIDHIANQIMGQVAPENITTAGFTPTQNTPAGGTPPPSAGGGGGQSLAKQQLVDAFTSGRPTLTATAPEGNTYAYADANGNAVPGVSITVTRRDGESRDVIYHFNNGENTLDVPLYGVPATDDVSALTSAGQNILQNFFANNPAFDTALGFTSSTQPAPTGTQLPPIGQTPPALPGQAPQGSQIDPNNIPPEAAAAAGVGPDGQPLAGNIPPDWLTHRPPGEPSATPDPTRVTPPPPAVEALVGQIANELYDSGSIDVEALVNSWESDPNPDGYGDDVSLDSIIDRVSEIDLNIVRALRDEFMPDATDAEAYGALGSLVADDMIKRWYAENPTTTPTPQSDPQAALEEQLESETPGILQGTISQLEYTLGSTARNTNAGSDVSSGLGVIILKALKSLGLFNRETINTVGRRITPEELKVPTWQQKSELKRVADYLNRNFIVDFQFVNVNGIASYVIKTDNTENDIHINVNPVNADNIVVTFSRQKDANGNGFVREYVFANEPGNQYLNRQTNQMVTRDARSVALEKALRIFGDTLGKNLREDLVAAKNFGTLSAVEVEGYLDTEYSDRGYFVSVANPDVAVTVAQEGENLFRVSMRKKSDGALIFSDANVSIDPKVLSEWQRTSQNAGRRRLDPRHIYTLAAEQAMRDHYGEPTAKRKRKGARLYDYEYNGEHYSISILTPHGNKTRDIEISRMGYKSKQVTLDAKNYDNAAFYAMPLIEEAWKPTKTGAAPPVPGNPEVGRVIQVPTLGGELEYYWQNPENPEDVILIELELVKETNVEEQRKHVNDRIIGNPAATAELVNKLNQFLTDLGADTALAKELQDLLVRDFGKQVGDARWSDVKVLKAAMNGQTQIYSAKATRDGFESKAFSSLYFNPLTENWQDRLGRTLPSLEWKDRPDFVRPKTSPIAKAKNVIDDIKHAASSIFRKTYAAEEKAVPFQISPSVEVDLLDEELMVAGEPIRKELLGQMQSVENGKRLNIIGRVITNIHELMASTQLARDGRNETSYAIYVDGNGLVISNDVISTGSIGSVAHEGDYIGRVIAKIENNPDIAKVYTFHNHPSGNSTPSGADVSVAAKIHDAMKNAGLEDKWGGLASHDSGRYSVTIDAEHYAFNVELTPEERGWEQDPLWTPAISDSRANKLVGKHLNTVFEELKKFRSDEGKITFVLTDFPHRASQTQRTPQGRADAQIIMGMFTLTDLDKLDGSNPAVLDGIERVVMDAFRTHGGVNVIGLFDDENIDNEILHRIQQRFNVQFYTTADVSQKRVDSTSNITDLNRIDTYIPPRDSTEAALDILIDDELRSRESRWFGKV